MEPDTNKESVPNLPQWQKDLIDSRLEEYKNASEHLLDWDAVWKELDKEDELPGTITDNISIAQYNKELDDAVKRIDAGEFTSHEDVEKERDTR